MRQMDSIRFLTVATGLEGLVHCHLHTFRKEAALSMQFRMLAYVEDESQSSHSILYNDRTLRVSPTLHAALVQIRELDEPDTLWWIGALCINHEDPTARASEINPTSEILSSASLIVCWLGVQPHDHTEALQNACDIVSETSSPLEQDLQVLLQALDWLFAGKWFDGSSNLAKEYSRRQNSIALVGGEPGITFTFQSLFSTLAALCNTYHKMEYEERLVLDRIRGHMGNRSR